MSSLVLDLRFALRLFARRPAFLLGGILSFALGISILAAVVPAVHSVLLAPLPFHEADRLLLLWVRNSETESVAGPLSPADTFDLEKGGEAIFDLAGYVETPLEMTLTGAGESRTVRGLLVYGAFFQVLGAQPALGRGVRAEESWDSENPVVVLSHGFWRELGADPDIVGKTLVLDGLGRTVVGVMPRRFGFPSPDLDLWTPVYWQHRQLADLTFRRPRYVRPVVRLRPGVSLEQAGEHVETSWDRLRLEFPQIHERSTAGVLPLRDWWLGDLRPWTWALAAAAALVLGMACTHAALLQVALLGSRRQEIAGRSAFGAGRLRLAGQMLTETLLLAVPGGLLGLLFSFWLRRVIVLQLPASLPVEVGSAPAWPVFLSTLAAIVTSAALVAAAPALQAAGSEREAFQEGPNASPRQRKLQDLLVVAEVALAFVLLTGAGLLLRSFSALQEVDPGFKEDRLFVAELTLPYTQYRGEAAQAFFQEALTRVRSLSGIESAALADSIPLEGCRFSFDLYVEGRPKEAGGIRTCLRVVSPGYFETMGVRLLEGEALTESHDVQSDSVAVINSTLAQKAFGGLPATGRKLLTQPGNPDGPRILGVVSDERLGGFRGEVEPQVFFSSTQVPGHSFKLVLRGRSESPPILDAVRAEVRSLDPGLPLDRIRWGEEILAAPLARERFVAVLASLFSGLSFFLTALGVFSLTLFSVAQRGRELGIRMALGATRSLLVRQILQRSLLLAGVGIALGGLGTWVAARGIAALLVSVPPWDPPTVAVAVVLLAAAVLLAALAAVRRALRLDPAVTLRR